MQPLADPMLYADLRDADLIRKLAALTPVPGFCICVDIVGSSGLKSAGVSAWVTATLEALACVRSCLYAKFPPIKSIGDALPVCCARRPTPSRSCRADRITTGATSTPHSVCWSSPDLGKWSSIGAFMRRPAMPEARPSPGTSAARGPSGSAG